MVDHGRVLRRHELTDQEWELLAPPIPRAATGRPRVEDRQVTNSMVYKIRTGISWRDLPERCGPWKTVCTRFRRYALDGVFTRAPQQIQAHADAAGDIDWLVQIDSTIVRAHQHAAATGRKRGQYRPDEPDDHAPGRSRGGLTTKIHLACDGKGRPFAILVTSGQRHDSIRARPLLEAPDGQLGLTKLARRMGISTSRLSHLVDRAREHGWVDQLREISEALVGPVDQQDEGGSTF
ncbi:IS5 family transposase [Streptomyces sp. NPDC090798]|uniref:IS5 family transposase n=1 Tax=Streptomyces sp. NPDC090798 TaxID=3365968 RepID=UPI003829E19D